MELGYVTRATRAQLQELVDKLPRDRQPELWVRRAKGASPSGGQ
ncbi:MAG: hypothetical protein AB7T14_03125 [Candidatus Methylacidiphilaceae bacterium]